jgi:hypothetical protein
VIFFFWGNMMLACKCLILGINILHFSPSLSSCTWTYMTIFRLGFV